MLLLDEPLANLDPRYQETFVQLLLHVKQSTHATILMTAHDPNPLLTIMDRVIYFAAGQSVIGKTHEVMTSTQLSLLYGIPIEVMHYRGRY